MLCSLRRPAAGVSVHLLHHRLLLPHRQGEPLCLPRTPACCHVLTPHQAALSGISAVGDGSGDDPPRQGRATPRRGRARHVDASRYERLPCAQRAQRLDARHGMPNRRHAQPSTCPTAPASLTRRATVAGKPRHHRARRHRARRLHPRRRHPSTATPCPGPSRQHRSQRASSPRPRTRPWIARRRRSSAWSCFCPCVCPCAFVRPSVPRVRPSVYVFSRFRVSVKCLCVVIFYTRVLCTRGEIQR